MNRRHSSSRWDPLIATTRGNIVELLRRSSRTVKQLAEALDMTQNAVRAHLVVLQRDGLVAHQTLRIGVGKPAYVYELTPQAEHLFPKGYGLVLRETLEMLTERFDSAEWYELLRTLGRRIAANYAVPSGSLELRLEAAVEVLNDLGGLVQIEDADGHFKICGYVCPISEVTVPHPEVCGVMESMLAQLVSERVHERCERSGSLACWFEVPKP